VDAGTLKIPADQDFPGKIHEGLAGKGLRPIQVLVDRIVRLFISKALDL
jgi:hypothetical protein